MAEGKVKIRYVEIDVDLMTRTMVLAPREAAAIKDKALTRLGIERREGEGHLVAWLRAMHEENGLPYGSPAHIDVASAIVACLAAVRFMWALA